MQEHTFGRIDAKPAEDLGIAQRQFDHLADSLNRTADSANIFIGNSSQSVAGATSDVDAYRRLAAHNHCSARHRLQNTKFLKARAKQGHSNTISGRHGHVREEAG